MKKYILLFFIVTQLHAMEPQKPAAQKKEGAGRFIQTVRSITSNHRVMDLIDEGVPVTPQDLYQLLQVDTTRGDNAVSNLEFWTHYGTYFLMYGNFANIITGVRSLQDLAQQAILKDTNPQRQQRYLQNQNTRNIILSASRTDLTLIKKEIDQIFDKVGKASEGDLSTQKFMIRTQMADKATQELTRLWEEIVQRQPEGFSVRVLEYIVRVFGKYKIPQAPVVLKNYMAIWIAKRCKELLRITEYLGRRQAIAPIQAGVKSRIQELAVGLTSAPLFVTNQEMMPYTNLAYLLNATPETCPAILESLLLQRLGSQAEEILKGQATVIGRAAKK